MQVKFEGDEPLDTNSANIVELAEMLERVVQSISGTRIGPESVQLLRAIAARWRTYKMTTLREKAEDTRDRLLGYISDLEDKLNSLKQILQKPIGEIVLNPCGVIQSHPLAIEKTATEFATLQEAIKLYG